MGQSCLLAIFDMDGTILDTVKDLGNATNFALRSCGFPEREMDEYYQLVGRGIYNLFRGAVPPEAATEENVQRMASYFIPYYEEHISDYTRPYEGIQEMFSALAARGVRLAIASNKYQAGTEHLAAKFFSEYDFVKILGQREGQPIKPDPAIVGQIIAAFRQQTATEASHCSGSRPPSNQMTGSSSSHDAKSPTAQTEVAAQNGKLELAIGSMTDDELKRHVVYVGDSNVDMQTGINAGVRTIGVSWGFRSREELAAYNPSAIVNCPAQLAEEILRLW